MVNVYVHDINAHYRRAESEGARIVTPLEDMFWGDRRYEALAPEGHRWHFAERVSEILARPADQPSSSNPVRRAIPRSADAFNDSYAGSTPAPWDIGRPQPAFARLAQAVSLAACSTWAAGPASTPCSRRPSATKRSALTSHPGQ